MNGTTLERPDVEAYLHAVRSELADLPAEERDELVADLEAQLVESDEPPRLPPREFAAELREAAGLESLEDAAPGAGARVRAWLASPRGRTLRATARELAPIWWVARAYVAVAAVALAVGWGWPVGLGTGSSAVAVQTSMLLVAAAVALSLWHGLRTRRVGVANPRLVLALNVALALVALPVLAHSIDELTYRPVEEFTAPEPTPGLAIDGVQLTNLYPYSRDGELLLDVLLYDEHGKPVEIFPGSDDAGRRVLTGLDGSRLFNSYPIRYFEPGTTAVAQPGLGPPVTVPEIVTPALGRAPR